MTRGHPFAVAETYGRSAGLRQTQRPIETRRETPVLPRGGPAFGLVSWRWRRDLNPRRVAPHALSRRALSAAQTRHRRRDYRIAPGLSESVEPAAGAAG